MIAKPKTSFIKSPLYLSYTALKDFLKCPHVYFLKNIYKDPKTGHKIQIASAHLSLGSTVHDAIKWYLEMKGQVTDKQVVEKFRNLWLRYRGKRGGFESNEQEGDFGRRGLKMLINFLKNVKNLEKITHQIIFPKYNLFDNVILIGNFDFIGEKIDGTLHVLDFKTGVKDEEETLQLYIYAILAETNLEKEVSSASFWYLDRDDRPKEIVLDPLEPKLEWLVEKGKQLKEAIEQKDWVCIKGPNLCGECRLYQAIIDGKGQFQFSDYRYKKDIYYLPR